MSICKKNTPMPLSSVVILCRRTAILLLAAACVACSEPEPVRLGFVGGISGRVADLGISGRNGALLAVEQRNAAGGIAGRRVELLQRDDEQRPETARRVVGELLAARVDAIVGPMTSSMVEACLPLADQAKIVMISPTVTSSLFSGRDDYFFRVVSSTRPYAETAARHFFERRNIRRVTAIYDQGNLAYVDSWLNDFRQRYEGLGGEVVSALGFASSADAPFSDIAKMALSPGVDGVLLLANSVDAAMLAQHLRRQNRTVPLLAAEWAATERLIELGGTAVDGMEVGQFMNRQNPSPEFQSFLAAYRQRFSQAPGFAGVAGYDAAKVVLDALAVKGDQRTLKETLLAVRHFEGAHGAIDFSEYGDAERKTYLTVVRDGQFHTVQ